MEMAHVQHFFHFVCFVPLYLSVILVGTFFRRYDIFTLYVIAANSDSTLGEK